MAAQLIDFIQNHWALSLAAVAVLALIIYEETKGKIGGALKISAQKAVFLLNREHATVIDLRDQKKFADGHIIGAKNIKATDIEQQIKKLGDKKAKPLILVDETETNAASVATKLQKHGFIKIHVLSGGMAAWKNALFPLEK